MIRSQVSLGWTAVVAGLQLCALVHVTWYSLVLDTRTCTSCGRLIVSLGEVLENSTALGSRSSLIEDDDFKYDFAFQTLVPLFGFNYKETDKNITNDYDNVDNARESRDYHSHPSSEHDFNNVPVDLSFNKDGLYEDFEDTIAIEGQVNVDIGLWLTSVCLPGGLRCVHLSRSQAAGLFRSVRPLATFQDHVPECHLLLLLSVSVTLVTLVITLLDKLKSRPARHHRALVHIGFISTASCTGSVLGAVTSYAIVLSSSDVVYPRIPYALYCTDTF
ncbi:hypothetical protein MAR_013710, partial [Mya arenaria]